MSNVSMGVRRFGRINWVGTFTLIEREIRRFMKVWTQTVMAPLINYDLPCAGDFNDDGDPECLCKYIIVNCLGEGRRQHCRYVDATLVCGRIGDGVHLWRSSAWCAGRLGHRCWVLVGFGRRREKLSLGANFCVSGVSDDGRAWYDRRHFCQ